MSCSRLRSTQASPSLMASLARWKSMMEKLPRRGQSWISGGSPAIRARVIRSCMMLMEPVITLHMPGVLGSPRFSHWLNRPP
ncbi:hypothetical protein D3C78_1696450 [compost metagenome]